MHVTAAPSPDGSSSSPKEQWCDLNGTKLECDFEGGQRTAPRFLLREGKKIKISWPLGSLRKIQVNVDCGEPFVRIELANDVSQFQPKCKQSVAPASNGSTSEEMFSLSARPGIKTLYVERKQANTLYNELWAHKEQGHECMQNVALEKCEGPSYRGLSDQFAQIQVSPGPSAQSAPEPAARTMLVFACTYGELKVVDDEAIQVNNVVSSKIQQNGTFEQLNNHLRDGRFSSFLFIGHGGLKLNQQSTLGFLNGGKLELKEPEKLAECLASHKLELVFLSGCYTETLGKMVHDKGVPHVVCWSTRVLDEVARIFSVAFFESLSQGHRHADAFEHAKQAVGGPSQNMYEMFENSKTFRLASPPKVVSSFVLTDPADVDHSTPHGYDVRGKKLPAPAGVPILFERSVPLQEAREKQAAYDA